MNETFTKWLSRHQKQSDAIGDLARDAAIDDEWPKQALSYQDFLTHLRRCGACDGAYNALSAAYMKYLSELGINARRQIGGILLDILCDECARPIKQVRDAYLHWTVEGHDDYQNVDWVGIVHRGCKRFDGQLKGRTDNGWRRCYASFTDICVPDGMTRTALEDVAILYEMADDTSGWDAVALIVEDVRTRFITMAIPAKDYGPQLVHPVRPASKETAIRVSTRYDIFKRDGFRCQICGRTPREDNVKLELGHKIARANGGAYHPDNLWTLCFDCNRGQGADNWIED